jgi:hypothetical protein
MTLVGLTANPRSRTSTASRGTDVDCAGSEHRPLVFGRERGQFRANLKSRTRFRARAAVRRPGTLNSRAVADLVMVTRGTRLLPGFCAGE